MKTSILLLVTVAALLTTCQAAPRKLVNSFDQRQDGKTNVQAKLEDFMILFLPSSSSGNADIPNLIETALLTQSIGLRNVIPRIASHPENTEISEKSEDTSRVNSQESAVKKVEEPEANVKSIPVQRDLPKAVESSEPQSNLEIEKKVKAKINTQLEAQDANEKSKKSTRSLAKVSSDLSVSKLPPIEKQIPLENKVAGKNEREDSVGPADREPQELKLIGGGIENCGPDRFRDRFGICQSRVETQ